MPEAVPDAFDGEPFDRPARVADRSTELQAYTVDQAAVAMEYLEAHGIASDADLQREIRKPDGPLPVEAFLYLNVLPTLSTSDGVTWNAWSFDPEAALEDTDAVEDATASLEVRSQREQRFITQSYWYLESVEERAQRPVSAYELHQEGPSLPAPAGVTSPTTKERFPDVPEALADLPGVVPPDPDAPDWEYTAEA